MMHVLHAILQEFLMVEIAFVIKEDIIRTKEINARNAILNAKNAQSYFFYFSN